MKQEPVEELEIKAVPWDRGMKKKAKKLKVKEADLLEVEPLPEVVANIVVEEMPEKVQIIETTSLQGDTTTQVVKKRVIRKKKGDIQEVTEIITKEEANKAPITTVTVVDMPIEEFEVLKPFEENLAKAQQIEELPEQSKIIETETLQGPKKTLVKKRILKKKHGRKESITEIVTKQDEGKEPTSTVKVTEIDLPFEDIIPLEPFQEILDKAQETFEELPEHIQVFEVSTDMGPKKTLFKKRTIKKKQGKKEEITEILTKQKEGEMPETVVTISEVSEVETIPDEKIEDLKSFDETPDQAIMRKTSLPKDTATVFKPELAELLVEFMKKSAAPLPSKPDEEEQTTEMVMEDGKPLKKKIKRKVNKTKKVSPDEENLKRLLDLEVNKTPLEEYEKVHKIKKNTKYMNWLTNKLTLICITI